jgi:RHS repeat-associated protein
VRPAQTISLSLQRQNNSLVAFQNDSTELVFSQANAARKRIAGLFVDTSATATGASSYTAVVKSYWTSGPDAGTVKQTTASVIVLRDNERGSPFGAGWSLAGWQRLVLSSDALSAVIVDGTGSIARFTRTCTTCNFTSPNGDFTALATLVSAGVTTGYQRKYAGGATYAFTAAGYDTTIVDRFGNTAHFVYNGSGQLTSVQDPAGKSLTFAYDANGKLSSITDPGGRVSHFSVNAAGDLVSITDPTGAIAFTGTYDTLHRLTQRTDRAGNSWPLAYDFASKLASDSTPAVLVDNVAQRLGTRYRSLEAATLIDPATGYGTSAAPAPQITSDSVRLAVLPPSGDSTRLAVDAFGAPLVVERPLLKTVNTITRDSQGRPLATRTTVRGQLVHADTTVWSGPRVAQVSDRTAGTTVTYAYDTTYGLVTTIGGNTQAVTNYLNASKTWVDSSRVGSIAGDTVSRYTHDSRGRITKAKDPKGDSTVVSYGTTGYQNTLGTTVGTRVTSYGYDGYGRSTSTTIPGGATSVVQYDSLNRERVATGPGGSKVTTTYDSLDVRSITDAQGQSYSYARNALGWVTLLTNANTNDPLIARQDSFYYNKVGAITAQRDRNGKRTSFGIDAQGRVVSRTLADGRVAAVAYDTAGFFVADSSGESIDTIRTNANGTQHTETTVRAGRSYAVTATADVNGLLRWMTLKDGSTTIDSVSYGYDADWRMDTILVNGARTRLAYNTDGMLTQLTLPSGDSAMYSLTGQHRVGQVTYGRTTLNALLGMNYSLDTLERVAKRETQAGDTSWTFAYDSLGRLTNYARYYNNPSETCTPDPLHQDGQVCTSGTPHLLSQTGFAYDTLGNRKDLGGTIVPGNRLTSFNGYTLSYDSVGNLTHKSKTGFDQYLYWNSIGQLDSVKTNGAMARYGYDAGGRRVRKRTASQTLWYIYAGDQVVAEVDSATATVQRKYRYYPGAVDAPHSVVTGGKTYYYLADPVVGSVLAVIDSTGAVANRYRYAPFGTLEDSLESVTNPIRFAGREYDNDTQLEYNRARYYDPQLGRFLSEDPLGLDGGVNQYAYAVNDPVNKRDPSGLWVYDGLSCIAQLDGDCMPHLGGSESLDTGIRCIGAQADCAKALEEMAEMGFFDAWLASQGGQGECDKACVQKFASERKPLEDFQRDMVQTAIDRNRCWASRAVLTGLLRANRIFVSDVNTYAYVRTVTLGTDRARHVVLIYWSPTFGMRQDSVTFLTAHEAYHLLTGKPDVYPANPADRLAQVCTGLTFQH